MEPFAALAHMRSSLEEGLALLEGASHDDPAVAEVLGRLAKEVAGASSPEDLRKAVPEAELESFDDELEELVRLNAVLALAVAQDRERLVGRLKAVRTSRRDLEYYGGTKPSGQRCDISG